jgi:hypothetical protein
MIGEAIVFDDPGPAGTPAGRLLGALIRNGCTVGISSRGMGALGHDRSGQSIVEQYQLVTFDCVHNPSTQKAYVFQLSFQMYSYISFNFLDDELLDKDSMRFFKSSACSLIMCAVCISIQLFNSSS